MRRVALVALLLTASCGGSSRFALRAPVLREGDERPLAIPPEKNEPTEVADAVDVVVLRPLAHSLAFQRTHEARNVNALDEVPNSSWFTARTVEPEALVRGSCPDAGPVPPFTIKTTKVGGVTPGFVVNDARHHKYVLKVDELARYGQPEISTAADAIVSRLYWAAGFNAPCNDVIDVLPTDIRVGPESVEISTTDRRTPLTAPRVTEMLRTATKTADGKLRMSASLFIHGKGIGTWQTEGTRDDDPNDVVPHQDRRELRGELFLAGWVAHWDSRIQNTYDTFVSAPGGGGHVEHYFIDFSDAIGGPISRTKYAEPRSGYESLLSVETIATDVAGFGFVRRPWDDLRVDPRYPNLGFLEVEHFDPYRFAPQAPLVRWQRAQPQDLAWMARILARINVEHVRVAAHTGHLSRPEEEARLVEILMGRRERILRASFAEVSPLADVTLFCGPALRDRPRAHDRHLDRRRDLVRHRIPIRRQARARALAPQRRVHPNGRLRGATPLRAARRSRRQRGPLRDARPRPNRGPRRALACAPTSTTWAREASPSSASSDRSSGLVGVAYDDLDAAVLGAPFDRVVVGDGPLGAETLGDDASVADAAGDEELGDAPGARERETDVLIDAAFRVGVALDHDRRVGVHALERGGDPLEPHDGRSLERGLALAERHAARQGDDDPAILAPDPGDALEIVERLPRARLRTDTRLLRPHELGLGRRELVAGLFERVRLRDDRALLGRLALLDGDGRLGGRVRELRLADREVRRVPRRRRITVVGEERLGPGELLLRRDELVGFELRRGTGRGRFVGAPRVDELLRRKRVRASDDRSREGNARDGRALHRAPRVSASMRRDRATAAAASTSAFHSLTSWSATSASAAPRVITRVACSLSSAAMSRLASVIRLSADFKKTAA